MEGGEDDIMQLAKLKASAAQKEADFETRKRAGIATDGISADRG